MSEGEVIQQLLTYWLQYADGRNDYSIQDFSEWLYQHSQQKKITNKKDDEPINRQHRYLQIGYLFGRIVNFSELWAKVAFQDLPIRQFEDYTILCEVREKVTPAKNELANLLVNEKSTAFEIIKRLIREELLQEKLDTSDRRVRRVSLTGKGKKVLRKADEQAYKVAQLLMGNTTEKEVDVMIKKFAELDRFHTDIYHNKVYTNIDDLLK